MAQVCYATLVIAVLGTASAAVATLDSLNHSNARRSWDADIDRIVAAQDMRRRLLALAQEGDDLPATKASIAGGQPAFNAEAAALDDASDARGHSSAHANAELDHGHSHRGGGSGVIPAIVKLPKTAATTAAAILLRFR
ncbi:MAG TPA: hypothetical protein VFA53_05725 [Xanthobacteraceae bacterium]|nr:hypothetical protein [Xanthobacteraceae bacterium]